MTSVPDVKDGAVGLLAALATPETFGAARRTEIDALTRQSLLTGQGR